ncbi:hypothetical protein J6590_001701 [Homalodisca vitripennis]|nr:hypothetical protein J6590_001701 [Homalodisca vitripennis]
MRSGNDRSHKYGGVSANLCAYHYVNEVCALHDQLASSRPFVLEPLSAINPKLPLPPLAHTLVYHRYGYRSGSGRNSEVIF